MYNRFRHSLFSSFGTSLARVRKIILSAALECTKKVQSGPWPKKVVHPWLRLRAIIAYDFHNARLHKMFLNSVC